MIHLLEHLQRGIISGKLYSACITNERVREIDLSIYKKFEKFHYATITSIDKDPVEDNFLLSASSRGAMCIHKLASKTSHSTYKAKVVCRIQVASEYSHNGSVCAVQWYPFDTGIFTSSGVDETLKIWETDSLRPISTFRLDNEIHGHHMSPKAMKHTLIAVAMKAPHAVLVDPRSGAYVHQLRGHSERGIKCVKWSPADDHLLATGGFDGKILFWDIRSAKGHLKSLDQHNGEAFSKTITAHDEFVQSFCFDGSGLYLLSCGFEAKLRLWDVCSGKNMFVNYERPGLLGRTFARNMDVYSDSSNPLAFVPGRQHISVYELFTGERVKLLMGHLGSVSTCVYRFSTQHLFSGGEDASILAWAPLEQTQNQVLSPSEDSHVIDDEDDWSSDD